MAVLGQMFFQVQVGSRSYGWDESHYLVGAGTLPTQLAQLQVLAKARAAMLGAGVQIPYLRVSDVDVFRDSQVSPGPNAGFQLSLSADGNTIAVVRPNPGGSPGGQQPFGINGFGLFAQELSFGTAAPQYPDLVHDLPNVGYMVRMEAGTNYTARRQLLIRGMPDGVIVPLTDGPDPAQSPMAKAWIPLYQAWRTEILNGKYGMKTLDTSPQNPFRIINSWTIVAGVPTANIADAVAQGGGAISPQLRVGQKVRLSRVQVINSSLEIKTYSGLVTVASAAPPLYTFVDPRPGSPFTGSLILGAGVIRAGLARLQTPSIQAYTGVVGRRWSSRKTGIPFDALRG